MKKILNRIEEIFKDKLQTKTGWGRNEVLAAYKDSVIQAMAETIEMLKLLEEKKV